MLFSSGIAQSATFSLTDQVIGAWLIGPTLDCFDLNLGLLQNILLIFALSPISPTQSQMAQSVSNS